VGVLSWFRKEPQRRYRAFKRCIYTGAKMFGRTYTSNELFDELGGGLYLPTKICANLRETGWLLEEV
jgi:hypothetical protein